MNYPLCTELLLLGAAGFCLPVSALDWPQWQGPDRNAISRETGLLQQWPAGGPPLAWKVQGLGGGDSAPAIAAGRILGMSHRGGNEVVWALSEKDGKELWVTALGPAIHQAMPQSQEGPACTPTVDGERVYVLGIGGGLACLQVRDGTVLWQKSLTEDFGGRVPTWSYRESPLIDGDKLICTPGGDDAMLVALNKTTGETIWKSQVPRGSDAGAAGPGIPGAPPVAGFSGSAPGGPDRGPVPPGDADRGRGRGRPGGPGGGGSGASYASAIAIDFEGQRQYVQFTAKALVGVAASDGKLLWQYERPANRMGINCSTPIYSNGLIFAASAYGTGGGVAKISMGANGEVKAEEVWFSRQMENHHGGVVLIDGALYGANGGNGGGYLICLDFDTGEILWNERDADKRRVRKGSVAVADGRIYYRTEEGTIMLIEPSRKEYLERGRFEQPERTDKPAWSHPVIANGKLYVRDQDALFCYDVRRGGT